MKIIATLSLVAVAGLTALSQNPTMTISHSGITPNKVMTVYKGQDIDFKYGSGQAHPMTEGWQTGEFSTPVAWTTRTVSSTVQSITFQIDTVGVFYFHCNNNAANSNNWGKITVVDSSSMSIDPLDIPGFTVSPNPVGDILNIDGFGGEASIHHVNGKTLMQLKDAKTNVSHLQPGIYFIESKRATVKFVKQ